MGNVYITVVLIIGSVYDWKYYGLPVWLLLISILGGLGGAVYSLLGKDVSLMNVGMAFLPGAIALILSYITKEQLGYGDGLLILALGGCMGLQQTIVVVGIALGVSFVTSVALVLSRKATRTQKIPFVPFLCIGWFIAWGGGVLFG